MGGGLYSAPWKGLVESAAEISKVDGCYRGLCRPGAFVQEAARSIIRRSERKSIGPGNGIQAVRKRMTSAQSLVDRATSS